MPTWIGVIDRVVLGIRISMLRGRVGQRAGVRIAVYKAPGVRVVVARPQVDQTGEVKLFLRFSK
jgi:hypothetical protein